ncbi:putative ncs1 allantoate transporter protein [Phaeoacremonium minimum UCRPA7]|uniref:Putative ncs1 allantoate transporter protein n=1 Tax=Phaeoacremonium minimum (strain UCR-PA7) TaxID=1286976 RepID=R8BUZ5_PHAM7|nr:putative ncs1 allantoate transporter protein [Phaeoacremonium minimum UCRPA7]EOO03177.1 putative ncs1 allantoate transporter protein [Phaeoacremonium minimum UCRPA7]
MAPASILALGLTWREAVIAIIFGSLVCTVPLVLNGMIGARLLLVIVSSVAVVITMTSKAGGTGNIWNLPYGVDGEARSWLILSSLSSITGGWATMATNIPDFTRYLKRDTGVYWQVLFLPGIQLMLGLFGIICCSAAKVVYGEYIWDPLTLAAQWDGPAGRCGAFFVGLTWVVAQIGTNLSANVISCANDICCLFPKYVNIKRGVILSTITAAWIMQPWKIIHSAASLLSFMAGLGIFLAPIAAILGCDYWLIHRQKIDVPGLYRAHGRYRYNKYGTNWRAAIAFLVSVVPNLPGMAATVNPSIAPSVGGAKKIYYMFYFWGYSSAFLVYGLLGYFWPEKSTEVAATIYGDDDIVEAAIGAGDSESQTEKNPVEEVKEDN